MLMHLQADDKIILHTRSNSTTENVWSELERLLAEPGSPERDFCRPPLSLGERLPHLSLGERGVHTMASGSMDPGRYGTHDLVEGPREELPAARGGGADGGAQEDGGEGAWFLLTATRRPAPDDVMPPFPPFSPSDGEIVMRAWEEQGGGSSVDPPLQPASMSELAAPPLHPPRSLRFPGSPPVAGGSNPGEAGSEPLGSTHSPASGSPQELWAAPSAPPAEPSGDAAAPAAPGGALGGIPAGQGGLLGVERPETAMNVAKGGSTKRFLITDYATSEAGAVARSPSCDHLSRAPLWEGAAGLKAMAASEAGAALRRVVTSEGALNPKAVSPKAAVAPRGGSPKAVVASQGGAHTAVQGGGAPLGWTSPAVHPVQGGGVPSLVQGGGVPGGAPGGQGGQGLMGVEKRETAVNVAKPLGVSAKRFLITDYATSEAGTVNLTP